MKEKTYAGLLEKLLTVVFWGILLISIAGLYQKIKFTEVNPVTTVISVTAYIALLLLAINNLKVIVSTISKENPFIRTNVKRFKQIAYSIFGLGIIDTIVTFPSLEGTMLIGTPYGGIKARIFTFIIMGFFALVMAEVFEMAARIKEEQDLTI